MKHNLFKLLIISSSYLFFLIFSSHSKAALSDRITCEISIDETQQKNGFPICCYVTIMNNSDEDLTLLYMFKQFPDFTVYTDGKTMDTQYDPRILDMNFKYDSVFLPQKSKRKLKFFLSQYRKIFPSDAFDIACRFRAEVAPDDYKDFYSCENRFSIQMKHSSRDELRECLQKLTSEIQHPISLVGIDEKIYELLSFTSLEAIPFILDVHERIRNSLYDPQIINSLFSFDNPAGDEAILSIASEGYCYLAKTTLLKRDTERLKLLLGSFTKPSSECQKEILSALQKELSLRSQE